MRRIAQQRAKSLAPFLHGLAIVDAGFDDGGWGGRADQVRDRLVLTPEPANQFGLGAVRPVIGQFGLVRRAPPSRAAAADRNHAHAKPRAKRLGEQFTRGKIAYSTPALRAAVNRLLIGICFLLPLMMIRGC